MFKSRERIELQDKLSAIDHAQAMIEFDMNGTILDANANFLAVMGYELQEIKGQKHAMFVDPTYRNSDEYVQFWERLRRGEAQVAQFKRIGKGGKEVWIEASYNPLRKADGTPYKVVKFAIDVTAQKQTYAELYGQVQAINKSQAVISFHLDGTVIDANGNFLSALGYGLEEIRGKHHSMFVEPAYVASREYKEFWERLRAGEYQAGQYKRIGKGGREVWIEASYNPILDPNGKPFKVIKYATEITAQVKLLQNLKVLIDHNFTEIDGAIAQTSGQAASASHSAGETSTNVQMVASAAEELAASAAEISESMAKSRSASDEAFQQTLGADNATQRLTNATQAMGGIVGLIQNIAGQINLLALNATIESARAGDAGKGFAVVANEVKNLANQAARATEQISTEIDAVQKVSVDVVETLSGIRASIETVRDFVTATASAVDEQSAVTRDMSANMQNASDAVRCISENVAEITAASLQAQHAVAKTKEAAQVLSR